MQLIEHFRAFLTDTVDLNATRVDDLEKSIQAIENFIDGSDWEPKVVGFEPHGSWAHKTIIRPVNASPFDADILVNVKKVDDWDAKKYINSLAQLFRASELYKDKISQSSHCVTITYAGERKIDVAPCVENRSGFVSREVCNRLSNQFELTEPTKYTNWLIERNAFSKNNSFRKVTRIIKYLRDIKKTFSSSSVLLTTLLANQIKPTDEGSSEFRNTPTALLTVIQRLDDYLQLYVSKPWIANPFLATENFADSWSDEQYENFRDLINKYRGWIEEAYDEKNRNESIKLWRKVLGDQFAKGVVLEEAKNSSRTAFDQLKKSYLGTTQLGGDLVDIVKEFGRQILPAQFKFQPHMQEPIWPQLDNPEVHIIIRADLHRTEQAPALREIESGQAIPKGHGLWFYVRNSAGEELSAATFNVNWRITNTGREAYEDNSMRGGIETSTRNLRRWERLSYRGVHLVEAFVVRKPENLIVGVSEPFYVTIE